MLASQSREIASRHPETGPGPQTRLASLILLAGSVRPSPLFAAIGRELTDLPIDTKSTILDAWQWQARELAAAAGLDRLLVRVLLDKATPSSYRASSGLDPVLVRIERDPIELRGTGGLLRDAALNAGDPDDFLLVTNLAQLVVQPLTQVLADVSKTNAEVVIINQRDGTPTSLLFIRRKCLELVPDVGFVDLKEQALAIIARHHRVAVLTQGRPIGLLVRTVADYIRALRWHHGAGYGVDPFAEEWSPSFSVVEEGAVVGAGAEVLDSVVLKGGRLDAGAVVVRSVVCPGGIVRRGRVVIDALVTAGTRSTPRGGH